MGKADRERLNQSLSSHLNTIHVTLQVVDQTPPSSVEKVAWEEVVKLGDQVSKQATIVGMLWTGEKPEAKAIEENMTTYFNMLQGFLLLSHGSRVGAGPTLSSSIHASMRQVVDTSFKLMTETVSSYGSRNKGIKDVVPQLVGAVWESCSALKKTPTSNITAIGRAMTQVAVQLKDVLREMNELKPDSANSTDEAFDGTGSSKAESKLSNDDDNDFSDDDLGNDLSREEMKVAQLGIEVVSETVIVMKELIRVITGLVKQEKPKDNCEFVNSLEKLLMLSQGLGTQIDEIGACLYPPQEVPAMKVALEKMSNIIDEFQVEVKGCESSSEAFFEACNGLKKSMKRMESELDGSCVSDIQGKMQDLDVSN